MVKRSIFEIILFTLLFSSFLGNELSYAYQILILVVLIISEKGKLTYNRPTKSILKGIIMILAVLFLSTIANLWLETYAIVSIYDIFKDIYHFSYPLIIIINGMLISRKITPHKFIEIVIKSAILSSIIHFSFILQTGDVFAIANDSVETKNYFLTTTGFIEVIAYFFLIEFRTKLEHKQFILLIILSSLLLYFSRTILILIFLVHFYDLRKNGLIKRILLLLTLSIPLLLSLSGTKFVDKLNRAPQEMFNTEFDSQQTITQNWRAYEAFMAINGVLSSPNYFPKIIGFGLGSRIDLGFYQNLNGNQFRFVNKIHNGVAEFFFKSGFIGLLIYLVFSLQLIFTIPTKKNKFIKFFSISLFISGFVIGGILNKGELSNFLFAYTFFCASRSELYD